MITWAIPVWRFLRRHPWAVLAVVVVLSVGAVWIHGKRTGEAGYEAQQARDSLETRGRMDEALERSRRDGGTWFERLQRLGEP